LSHQIAATKSGDTLFKFLSPGHKPNYEVTINSNHIWQR